MRKFFPVFVAAMIFAASSWSAEKAEYLDGVISTILPPEWTGRMDGHEQTLTFGPEASPTSRIGFSTPSPNHTDPKAMTIRNFDLINLLFDGTLEILEEDADAQYGDKRGHGTKFTVNIMGSDVFGITFAYTQYGYMVMALAMAQEEDFEKYLPEFEQVIADFELNAEALNRNAEKLKSVADVMDANYDAVMAELEAMAEAETAGDPGDEEYFKGEETEKEAE